MFSRYFKIKSKKRLKEKKTPTNCSPSKQVLSKKELSKKEQNKSIPFQLTMYAFAVIHINLVHNYKDEFNTEILIQLHIYTII